MGPRSPSSFSTCCRDAWMNISLGRKMEQARMKKTRCFWSERPFSVTVYCYCFSNADDVVTHTRSRVEAVLGTTFGEENCQIRNVRNVAPKKEMMVAKVRLTSDVLLSKNCEPMTKRQKVG